MNANIFFKSILCLNSILPQKNFFDIFSNLILMASDGAANTLLKQNIMPDFVVGDLDSFKPPQILARKVNILYRPDQNYTDFEKCLLELEKLNLFPTLILGLNAGEADHVLYNFSCFMKYSTRYNLIFYEPETQHPEKWGIPISKYFSFQVAPKSIVSLIPYPEAMVSTTGLKWPLHQHKLSQCGHCSIRNITVDNPVTIQVHSGVLLMLLSGKRFQAV